ncbi:hypothetical protein GSI_10698 [Ganoderma sinense ZZ0214-1]|uniref:Uncharacterized protein n=1 Tax=Ganoderma sinense ZZ0214-1 TaxID=1077348 RepID=A0A2G8S1D5_9APHY|nr:hypothetical protein GSI_10698 [Ganoderma sinense ZZ0214-1]
MPKAHLVLVEVQAILSGRSALLPEEGAEAVEAGLLLQLAGRGRWWWRCPMTWWWWWRRWRRRRRSRSPCRGWWGRRWRRRGRSGRRLAHRRRRRRRRWWWW